jgi:hypothetical protein
VAQEHGGELTLESVEGKGATFRLRIPADLAGSHDPGATAASRASMHGTSHGGGHGGENVRPG